MMRSSTDASLLVRPGDNTFVESLISKVAPSRPAPGQMSKQYKKKDTNTVQHLHAQVAQGQQHGFEEYKSSFLAWGAMHHCEESLLICLQGHSMLTESVMDMAAPSQRQSSSLLGGDTTTFLASLETHTALITCDMPLTTCKSKQ